MFPHAALTQYLREKECAMAKRIFLSIALLAVWALLLSACGAEPPPEQTPPPETPAPMPEVMPTPTPAVTGFETYEMQINGEHCGWTLYDENGLFLDPRPLMERCGLITPVVQLDDKRLTIDAGDAFHLESRQGDNYLCVNGRYFYAPQEYVADGETVYLPAEVIQRLFCVSAVADEKRKLVEIDAEELKLLEGGKYYYDVNFSGDDIYWLSHIIQAEADNQKLDAMIGVGNVVLNRTKAEEYPDTVFAVIFDYQNAPQFSPRQSTALSRMITPDVQIAAYLCLEGYNTVGSCLYFQNPYGVETNWISYAREYALSLGDLDFYY